MEPALFDAELGSDDAVGEVGQVVEHLADDDDDQRHAPGVERVPREATSDATPAVRTAILHRPAIVVVVVVVVVVDIVAKKSAFFSCPTPLSA